MGKLETSTDFKEDVWRDIVFQIGLHQMSLCRRWMQGIQGKVSTRREQKLQSRDHIAAKSRAVGVDPPLLGDYSTPCLYSCKFQRTNQEKE